MDEIWRTIPGYAGLYEASNHGRIRTVLGKTTSNTRHEKRVWNQRILKPKGTAEGGGLRVNLWKDGIQRDWLVHRLVAMTFIDMLEQPEPTVNHKDGNRLNNSIENLEWASLGDNIRHAFRTGLAHQKSTTILDKRSGVTIWFRSLADASRHFGKNDGYISNIMKKGIVENELLEIL